MRKLATLIFVGCAMPLLNIAHGKMDPVSTGELLWEIVRPESVRKADSKLGCDEIVSKLFVGLFRWSSRNCAGVVYHRLKDRTIIMVTDADYIQQAKKIALERLPGSKHEYTFSTRGEKCAAVAVSSSSGRAIIGTGETQNFAESTARKKCSKCNIVLARCNSWAGRRIINPINETVERAKY